MTEIMTTKELAAYLQFHEATICKYVAKGIIPGMRIGRAWRFDKAEIDKWIKGSQAKQKGRKKPKSRRPSKAR